MANDFRLDEWLVKPSHHRIERGEEVFHLKPKAMAVLECLARARGGVVTRNELFDRIWPGGTVSDAMLTQCIVELRRAFHDTAKQSGVIETIPKVGFRLVPQVSYPYDDSAVGTAMGRKTASLILESPKMRILLTSLVIASVILLVMSVFWYRADLGKDRSPMTGEDVKTLAVLPFTDMSEEQSQGWLADGVSEELINRLTQLEGLQVTGRTSTFYFKDKNESLETIAAALGVDYVIEGSVRKDNQTIRITAQLVKASDGFHLWSNAFDRPASDIFEIQEEIAESVAVALSVALGVGQVGTELGGTSSVKAFDLTLQAEELFRSFSPESILKSIELLKQAVEVDPGYASAWASLATAYYLAPVALDDTLPPDWLALSEEALSRAKLAEPDLPKLLSVAVDLYSAKKEWRQVEKTMNRENHEDIVVYPSVLFSYGVFLVHVGRVREAMVHLERARFLEPLATWIGSKLGYAFMLNNRFEDSLAECERVWNLDHGNRYFQSTDGLVASLAAGKREVILKWLERAAEYSDPSSPEGFTTMLELLDDRAAALAWLRESYERTELIDYWIAVWAAYYGDTQLALDAMLRSPDSYALWSPLMTEVRKQPQFKRIVNKLGLVEYWREFRWADSCHPVGDDNFECG